MKIFKFLSYILICSLLLLYSCQEESNNQRGEKELIDGEESVVLIRDSKNPSNLKKVKAQKIEFSAAQLKQIMDFAKNKEKTSNEIENREDECCSISNIGYYGSGLNYPGFRTTHDSSPATIYITHIRLDNGAIFSYYFPHQYDDCEDELIFYSLGQNWCDVEQEIFVYLVDGVAPLPDYPLPICAIGYDRFTDDCD